MSPMRFIRNRRATGSRIPRAAAVVLAAVLAVAGAVAVAAPASAIVGGTTAKWPGWTVQVYDVRTTGDVYQCTGSLVARSWILTAQHCLADPGETTAVRVGSANLGAGTRIAVDRSVTPSPTDDVALLHLVQPTSTSLPLVPLATKDPGPKTTLVMYGWGAQAAEQPGQPPVMSPVLKQATSYFEWIDHDSLGGPGFVTWSLGGTGAGWHGDSGGPVMLNGKQVGLMSSSDGPIDYAFMNDASVAAHLAWIRSYIGR